ncbi:MAG TPA: NUDIX domain-containing protein [Patescibacteria group bacterium]|nr:NUDIX domain-containing protein [Patescibacteria group bacterium]
MNTIPIIQKAGGVVVRQNGQQETEVYVVHRPRYDDWSLPKGHIDAGETPKKAALREVLEETGFYCEISRSLPDYCYELPDGKHVCVSMYEMHVITENNPIDTEVDRGEWKMMPEAVRLISYPSLQKYLRAIY